jgi:DNA-binding MarR family transcriptional regulator
LPQQEPIGLLVAVVRRRIKQAVAALVQDTSLSPQQFWTIVLIAENEGCSLGELAERRQMDQPTASRVVSTLMRRRLLRNSPDPSDRRRSRLLLTPSGRELLGKLLPLAEKIRSTVDSALTASEREAVVKGLHKIVARLDRFESERAGTLAAGAAGSWARSPGVD